MDTVDQRHREREQIYSLIHQQYATEPQPSTPTRHGGRKLGPQMPSWVPTTDHLSVMVLSAGTRVARDPDQVSIFSGATSTFAGTHVTDHSIPGDGGCWSRAQLEGCEKKVLKHRALNIRDALGWTAQHAPLPPSTALLIEWILANQAPAFR